MRRSRQYQLSYKALLELQVKSEFNLYPLYKEPDKLNSLLTCFQQGSIILLVEHRTGIAQVMGSNPVEASESFLDFLCNYFSSFITARIIFTCVLYPRCIDMVYIIYTSFIGEGVGGGALALWEPTVSCFVVNVCLFLIIYHDLGSYELLNATQLL